MPDCRKISDPEPVDASSVSDDTLLYYSLNSVIDINCETPVHHTPLLKDISSKISDIASLHSPEKGGPSTTSVAPISPS